MVARVDKSQGRPARLNSVCPAHGDPNRCPKEPIASIVRGKRVVEPWRSCEVPLYRVLVLGQRSDVHEVDGGEGEIWLADAQIPLLRPLIAALAKRRAFLLRVSVVRLCEDEEFSGEDADAHAGAYIFREEHPEGGSMRALYVLQLEKHLMEWFVGPVKADKYLRLVVAACVAEVASK